MRTPPSGKTLPRELRNGISSSTPSPSPKHRSLRPSRFYEQPTASSLRKWVSHADVVDGGIGSGSGNGSGSAAAKSPTAPAPSPLSKSMLDPSVLGAMSPGATAASIARRRLTSNSSLASTASQRSLAHVGIRRDPYYNSDDGYLCLYLRNRPVKLFAPIGIDSFPLHQPQPAPSKNLKLDWIYGYQGKTTRNNIYSLPTGEIVYFTASIVVLYNQNEHTQRFFTAHSDEIRCIALHPNRLLIATGQSGKGGAMGQQKVKKVLCFLSKFRYGRNEDYGIGNPALIPP